MSESPAERAGSDVFEVMSTCRAPYALMFRDELEAVLELPEHVHVQAVIPIGFPIGRFGPVRRPPVDQVMMFDRWSGMMASP